MSASDMRGKIPGRLPGYRFAHPRLRLLNYPASDPPSKRRESEKYIASDFESR